MSFDDLDDGRGGRFVATVYAADGRYHADCFCEFPPPTPGFGAETDTVHRDDAASVEQARAVAETAALANGFDPAEIVWR